MLQPVAGCVAVRNTFIIFHGLTKTVKAIILTLYAWQYTTLESIYPLIHYYIGTQNTETRKRFGVFIKNTPVKSALNRANHSALGKVLLQEGIYAKNRHRGNNNGRIFHRLGKGITIIQAGHAHIIYSAGIL